MAEHGWINSLVIERMKSMALERFVWGLNDGGELVLYSLYPY